MKKRYVKIMFLSMALLVISTAATYAVQPKDEPKETVQTPTEVAFMHYEPISIVSAHRLISIYLITNKQHHDSTPIIFAARHAAV